MTIFMDILELHFDAMGLDHVKQLQKHLSELMFLPASDLTPDVLSVARTAWENRVRAEYVGTLSLQMLHSLLVDMNAPMDLQEAAIAFMLDEQRHVRACMQVAQALGSKGKLNIDTQELSAIAADLPVHLQVLDFVVRAFCVGEVVALDLLKCCLSSLPSTEFRSVLLRIYKDEIIHSQFGELLLEKIRANPQSWCPWPGDEWIQACALQQIGAMRTRPVVEPEELELAASDEKLNHLVSVGIPSPHLLMQTYRESLDRLEHKYLTLMR